MSLTARDTPQQLNDDYGTDNSDAISVTLDDGKVYSLPDDTRIKLVGSNRIAKDYPLSGDGSVKQFLGTGDWKIILEGLCINREDQSQYPEEQLRLIGKLKASHDPIGLQNRLTSMLCIYTMVIESVELEAPQPLLNTVKFKITALSTKGSLEEVGRKRPRTRQNSL